MFYSWDIVIYSEKSNNVLAHLWSLCELLSILALTRRVGICFTVMFFPKLSPNVDLNPQKLGHQTLNVLLCWWEIWHSSWVETCSTITKTISINDCSYTARHYQSVKLGRDVVKGRTNQRGIEHSRKTSRCKDATNDNQMGHAIKWNDTPDRNSRLSDCVAGDS